MQDRPAVTGTTQMSSSTPSARGLAAGFTALALGEEIPATVVGGRTVDQL